MELELALFDIDLLGEGQDRLSSEEKVVSVPNSGVGVLQGDQVIDSCCFPFDAIEMVSSEHVSDDVRLGRENVSSLVSKWATLLSSTGLSNGKSSPQRLFFLGEIKRRNDADREMELRSRILNFTQGK